MNSTDPQTKFRYARGLGDLVACFLHSKPVGWFTHLITGKTVPCAKCNARADALNLLVPIPFWKLFFESEEELIEALRKDYIANGWDANSTPDRKGLHASKAKNPTIEPTIEPINLYAQNGNISTLGNIQGTLVGSSETRTAGFLIKTQVYKC